MPLVFPCSVGYLLGSSIKGLKFEIASHVVQYYILLAHLSGSNDFAFMSLRAATEYGCHQEINFVEHLKF